MTASLLSLFVLGVIWGTSLFRRGRSFLGEYHWKIFASAIALFFSFATYQAVRLYQATYSHPMGKFFDIEYFLIFRVGFRIFAPYLISLLVSLVFVWIATRYNRKYNERFFEKEEIQLGGLSFFLVGHPGWIFYFPLLVFIYLVIQIFYNFILGNTNIRVPVYHLWVPTALFVILISEYWLSSAPLWLLLKI